MLWIIIKFVAGRSQLYRILTAYMRWTPFFIWQVGVDTEGKQMLHAVFAVN